ncbi:hypothetical protein [uncultured Dokdonia sp.]|uniref:hypothetical protein n=1 Tax=uncultured Dokdonia sp. TaxID=575653 RepID=UPI00260ED1B9|nr:hypothetical protein [uncultured Dokdonia sp.]
MKNIVIKLMIIVLTVVGCSSDEKPIDILLNAPNGALLINTEIGNTNFIMNDLESRFSVEVRAHDQEKGDFFDFIRVYISFKSNTSNGTDNRGEVILQDIPRSEFYTGEFGRPRILLNYSFQQALDALGLSVGDIAPGDQFYIRPDMYLKDGRIIGYENRSPTIFSKYCENSPFYYQINVISPIENTLFTGVYSYEVISSSSENEEFSTSGITTIINGDFPNQRRSSVLDFTITDGFVIPDIYQEEPRLLCDPPFNRVFWGPQENNFGVLSLQDDTVFEADFVRGYDGWVGGDLSSDPITIRYRFSKQ